MGVALKGGGDVVLDRALDSQNILAGGDAGAVAKAEDMGIDRLCGHAEPDIQNHIGGLATDTRQALQGGARRGHLAVKLADQNFRHADHVFGLLAKQADGFYLFGQPLKAERQHFLRGIDGCKKAARCLVDTGIGCLCRQRYRNYKGIGIDMVQLALGVGFAFLEAAENLVDGVVIKLLAHGFRICHATAMLPSGNRVLRKKRVAKNLLIRHHGAKDEADMTQNPYHYDLIARALAYIEAERDTAPSLKDVARAAGLSPAHFQRLFSQWVGVSPKRYHQYLLLDQAKTMLRQRFSLLETAQESGLSGASRLHDLFLTWEAMSPGQYAARGAGLTIRHGWFDGPFGEMLVMGTTRGICGMAFTAECGRAVVMQDMRARWPNADFLPESEALRPWVEAALGQRGHARLHLIGAPFQIKVWEALLAIPSGHVTTYSQIANAIGTPRAARAVGTAVGRNPISWLIPCHRVLRKSGALGGYHWGLPVKRALLAWESARLDARD